MPTHEEIKKAEEWWSTLPEYKKCLLHWIDRDNERRHLNVQSGWD